MASTASAASADSDLLRGMPCWSTTTNRTVRRPSSLIRAATSSAALACRSSNRPCRAMKPGWPTPAAVEPVGGFGRNGAHGVRSSAVLSAPAWVAPGLVAGPAALAAGSAGSSGRAGPPAKLSGSTSASDRKVSVRWTPGIWKIVFSSSSRRCVWSRTRSRTSRSKAAGDHAHVLGLGQGPDRADDLAQVHARVRRSPPGRPRPGSRARPSRRPPGTRGWRRSAPAGPAGRRSPAATSRPPGRARAGTGARRPPAPGAG